MSEIKIQCKNCLSIYDAPVEFRGDTGYCNACGSAIIVEPMIIKKPVTKGLINIFKNLFKRGR